MFTRTLRPLARTLPTVRSISSSTSSSTAATSSRRNLYLSTLAATVGLATYGYSSVVSERNLVRNDVTGSGNFDSGKQQYNEDLKVNRHKSESGVCR